MDFRKFYFIICVVISILLFFTGSVILAYIGMPSDGLQQDNNPNNLLSDILDPLKQENKPVNFLILGGDMVAGNSDTMILVNYNPVSSKLNLMSIPRDTRTEVKGASIDKINSAYPVGGGKLAIDTVSDLLSVNISYYIYLDTSVFRELVDLLGGVNYNVPVNMNYDDPIQNLHIHLEKGMQLLDGGKAEQFMRFRQPNYYTNEIWEYYDGSDIKRIEAQQSFIKELIKQKLNIYTISKINDIINVVFSNLDTNITLSEALKMSAGITQLDIDKVNMYKLPGEPAYDGLWYFYMDETASQEIIKKNFFSWEGFKEKDSNSPKKTYNKSNLPIYVDETEDIATPSPEVTASPTSRVIPTPSPSRTIKVITYPTAKATHKQTDDEAKPSPTPKGSNGQTHSATPSPTPSPTPIGTEESISPDVPTPTAKGTPGSSPMSMDNEVSASPT